MEWECHVESLDWESLEDDDWLDYAGSNSIVCDLGIIIDNGCGRIYFDEIDSSGKNDIAWFWRRQWIREFIRMIFEEKI